MSGHTPGPWAPPVYDGNPGDRGWWIRNGRVGADEFAVAVTFELNPNAEADSRLIAAAPELLQALKALRVDANRLCDRNLGGTYEDDCRCSIRAADAAIAKAEGRQ